MVCVVITITIKNEHVIEKNILYIIGIISCNGDSDMDNSFPWACGYLRFVVWCLVEKTIMH